MASDHPAVTSTNELVHMFLFSGKLPDHTYPAARQATLAAANPTVFAPVAALRECSQIPVSKPSKAVPIAGILLSIPSGSRTLWPCASSSKCPGEIILSSHDTIFCVWSMNGKSRPGIPAPGTGTQRGLPISRFNNLVSHLLQTLANVAANHGFVFDEQYGLSVRLRVCLAARIASGLNRRMLEGVGVVQVDVEDFFIYGLDQLARFPAASNPRHQLVFRGLPSGVIDVPGEVHGLGQLALGHFADLSRGRCVTFGRSFRHTESN